MQKYSFPHYWLVNSQVDKPVGIYAYEAVDAAKFFILHCLQKSDHDFGGAIVCKNLRNRKKTVSFITQQFLQQYFPEIVYRITQ